MDKFDSLKRYQTQLFIKDKMNYSTRFHPRPKCSYISLKTKLLDKYTFSSLSIIDKHFVKKKKYINGQTYAVT